MNLSVYRTSISRNFKTDRSFVLFYNNYNLQTTANQMAAYAALLSLNFTIGQIQPSIIPERYKLQSLKQIITFLLGFFQHHYDNQDIQYERDVVNNAYAFDFFVEWHSLNSMLIESGYSGENNSGPFPEEQIQLVIHEFDSIKNYAMQIMDMNKKSETLINYGSSSSSFSTTVMVGFNKHLNWIMDAITSSGSGQLQILPIIGMGGIGKTTLVRNVFDNRTIKERFDIRLWSEAREVQNVLLCFLRDLGIANDRKTNGELWGEVYKAIVGRRYLIVIDDIWSIEVWDAIRRFFPNDGNESRIIITTRLLDVASHIGSPECGSYKLELLNDDESWKLLKEKVFAQNDCPSVLENIGKRIATTCGGLPLAIVVIAGQLAKSDMAIETWENVAGSLNSIVNSENDNLCLNILSLSYDNLPAFLKPCFLYMGIFPEDFTFKVSRLVMAWVAEGFVKPVRGKCLEDTAFQYLTYLVERNLVSVSNRGSSGKMKRCRVHDLLRDLCLRKAHELNFLQSRTRHRYRNDSPPSAPLYVNKFHSKDETYYPLNLLSMRVHGFELSDFKMASTWDSDPRGNLILFSYRYICLSHGRFIGDLNLSSSLASLSMLRNLQTLIMNEVPGNEPVVLPPQIWEMAQIRHLLIQRVTLPDPPIYDTRVNGKELCVLENMQTLLVLYNFWLSEEVIKRIPNLKKLKIIYKEASDSDSVEWPCNHLCNLLKLYKLESLLCSMYKSISAANISFPQSLKKLTLAGGNIPWEEMTTVGLGKLPNLVVFRLHNDAFYGNKWTPSEGEFLQLKALHLDTMSLELWEADSIHFPKLEELTLYNVWRMKEIPLGIGTTLNYISLELCSMSLYYSVRVLQEDQENYGNCGIQFNAPMKEIIERMPFFLSALVPDPDPSFQVPKLEFDLRHLNVFLSYTIKNRTNNEKLKMLVSHIRHVMHEAKKICKDITMELHNGNLLYSSHTKFLHIIKEIGYLSVYVRAQDLLSTIANGNPEENQDRMLDKEPVDLINITNHDEAISSEIIPQFPWLTVVDESPDTAMSIKNPLYQTTPEK